jgi:hypothetical protein
MTPRRARELRRLAARPWTWPGLILRLAVTKVVQWRRPTFITPATAPGQDPEILWGPERANDMLGLARELTSRAAFEHMDALLQKPALASDPYTRSQRLAHAAYLWRLEPALKFSSMSLAQLRTDAAALASQPEFRLQNYWFNNHLLNNYRALLLTRTQLPASVQPADLDTRLAKIEELLLGHLATLFVDGHGPVLAEGSLSYELLILRHLIDIACCGSTGKLPTLARAWVSGAAGRYCASLRRRDQWLIPAIGDLSPDWTTADIHDFLDGVFLRRDTIYRRIWGSELDRLALHHSFAVLES